MKYSVDKKYSKETHSFVNEVISYLKEEDLIKTVDSASLNILCYYYEVFTEVSNRIIKDGYLVEKQNGDVVENPLAKKLNDIEIQLFKILQEYGLTPLSRKKLKIEADKQEDSPLAKFLNNEV